MTGVRTVFTSGESGTDRQQARGKVRECVQVPIVYLQWWPDSYDLPKKSLSGLWLQFVHFTWSHRGWTPSFRSSERSQWPGAIFTTSTQSSRCQEAAFRWGSRKNITRRILSSQHSNGSSNRSTNARGSRGEGTCRSSCWLRKKDDCVSKNVSVIQGEEHDNTHQSTWFTALTNCRANSSAWKEVCPWKDNSLLELRVSQLAVVD